MKDGQVKPLHVGANSVMLLAHQSAEILNRILEDLRTRPGIQLADERATVLVSRAAQAREAGYAMSFGESKAGYYVVSVPIFAADGSFQGVLGLSKRSSGDAVETAIAEARILKVASARLQAKF